MDEGGTQGKRMRKRWVSSLLPSIKWQDERKKQRGAALAYRYLWSWKRCHCILLIYFFFPINLSHQFLKMCKYLATREILSFSFFSIFFFCVNFFAHFEAATCYFHVRTPSTSCSACPALHEKGDAEWTVTPFLRPLRTLQTSVTPQLCHFLEWWSLIYLLILCKVIVPLPW